MHAKSLALAQAKLDSHDCNKPTTGSPGYSTRRHMNIIYICVYIYYSYMYTCIYMQVYIYIYIYISRDSQTLPGELPQARGESLEGIKA